ncbi:hypothetical protein GF342_02755 [Candidatus Woesearchaeota archaeon]|nr:hypothetical protein [Candidatus Woesearchaeota archaeon]
MAKKKSIFDGDYEEEGIEPEEFEFLDEPEEHTETSDEIEMQMHIGETPVDVYSEEGLDEEMENDEIEPWEEGFMHGELHGGSMAECYTCGKVLDQESDDIFEREVEHVRRVYCSVECRDQDR